MSTKKDTRKPGRSPSPPAAGSATPAIKQLTLGQAEVLAKRCEYAWLAVNTINNPINWGDAAAFFLEGWNQGMRDAITILKGYKPKGTPQPNAKVSDGWPSSNSRIAKQRRGPAIRSTES